MPKLVTSDQESVYWLKRKAGYPMRDAAKAAGFSLSYARALQGRTHQKNNISDKATKVAEIDLPAPIRYDDLIPEAQRAFNDFAYFQRRYFGRIPQPWQAEAAAEVLKLQATDDEEYVVANAPPGAGKTILWTHDIPAWLTVRNRSIRGMLGSVTGPLASRPTDRLRRTFERTTPVKAKLDDLSRGWALDAEACLAEDFGIFKPLDNSIWTREAFIVAQYEDVGAVVEKEPTWSSYGIDMGFIGGRYDVVIWDDLMDPRKFRTTEAMDQLESDYDDLCETRLEPAGLLILNGQRLGARDIYRYALNKKIPELVDPETDEVLEESPKYHHLKYPAHDSTKCSPENHRKDAPAWPEGCLLSPQRLPWRKLQGIRSNSANKFEVVYQQEDVDPDSVLVQKGWVYGDSEHGGCVDKDRDRLEVPKGLSGRLVSIACADPSPTKFWGITWWAYHPDSEQRFLVDLKKGAMEAPDFLDWNANNGEFSGLMEEWHHVSQSIGYPITHWIVEINAAQRFLLQFDHVKRWQRKTGVKIIPHSTMRNKSDPNFGVQTLAPHYESGRVRLPYKPNSMGRLDSLKLIQEVTTYPGATTTDLMMSQWFLEWQLPHIYHEEHAPVVQKRPSWIKDPRKLRMFG